jgi:hypothetical protein
MVPVEVFVQTVPHDGHSHEMDGAKPWVVKDNVLVFLQVGHSIELFPFAAMKV